MTNTNLNEQALKLEREKSPYIWATVVNIKGSAPRHVGSKMIITKTEIFGTIGGGALEHQVIKDAKEQLRVGKSVTKNYPLGPLLGQCCGGDVDVFIEPVLALRDIIVFGAGHISEHLIPMLKQLNFNVTLVDEREERINLPIFKSADNLLNELPTDALKEIDFNDDLYMIVLTHAHIHDQEIVEYCLDKPYKYLGVIGSATKWEKFKSRYRAKGFKDNQLEKVVTPIGLDIGGETPFELAVAISAELIHMNGHLKGYGEYKRCQK